MKASMPAERKLLFNALGVVAGLAVVAFSSALETLIFDGICWIIRWATNSTGEVTLVTCADLTSVVMSGSISLMLDVIGISAAVLCLFGAVFALIKIMREQKKEKTATIIATTAPPAQKP